LAATVADLLPAAVPPDTLAVLKGQVQRLFDALLRGADRETPLMLNPLLARLVESTRSR
jgi:hypothetical protein